MNLEIEIEKFGDAYLSGIYKSRMEQSNAKFSLKKLKYSWKFFQFVLYIYFLHYPCEFISHTWLILDFHFATEWKLFEIALKISSNDLFYFITKQSASSCTCSLCEWVMNFSIFNFPFLKGCVCACLISDFMNISSRLGIYCNIV